MRACTASERLGQGTSVQPDRAAFEARDLLRTTCRLLASTASLVKLLHTTAGCAACAATPAGAKHYNEQLRGNTSTRKALLRVLARQHQQAYNTSSLLLLHQGTVLTSVTHSLSSPAGRKELPGGPEQPGRATRSAARQKSAREGRTPQPCAHASQTTCAHCGAMCV